MADDMIELYSKAQERRVERRMHYILLACALYRVVLHVKALVRDVRTSHTN